MLVENRTKEIKGRGDPIGASATDGARDGTTLGSIVPTGLYHFLSRHLPTFRPYGTGKNVLRIHK